MSTVSMASDTQASPRGREAASSGGGGREGALVTRAKDGDAEAYGELVRTNVRRVRAYLALRAPAQHLVDELAQEAFIVAHRKLDKLRSGTPFLSWVRGIAWQLLRRETKRFRLDEANRARLLDHVSILQDRAVDEAKLDNRVERLERCLEKVSSAMRRLLDLRYRDGMKSKEIAVAVGESDDWVRTNLCRTRRQLRGCVERG